jgi:hypothetical protein
MARSSMKHGIPCISRRRSAGPSFASSARMRSFVRVIPLLAAIALGGCSGSSASDLANAAPNPNRAPSSSSSSSSAGENPPTDDVDAGTNQTSDAATSLTSLPASFTKRMLDTTTYPNALCNDGSAAGYYPAAGATGSQAWIVFLEGGSWCSSDADCAGRSASLSSSAGWAATISPSGIISGDVAASAAGKFQFRGRSVIDAVIADLKSTYGFGQPGSTVLLAGASAGGVSVLVTADRVAASLPRLRFLRWPTLDSCRTLLR